ncbi:MAG: chorismate mutase [Victivallales bacterium]|nr:chorismate mutase [Victivallales bacterium]
MNNLTDIRKEIDSIDEELTKLLVRRFEIVADVAKAKHENGLPISDPSREREILSRMTEKAGPEYENAIRMMFTTMFGLSKAHQRMLIGGQSHLLDAIAQAQKNTPEFPSRALVACPGIEGSYAQQATSMFFKLPSILFFNSFEKIFEAVEKGLCPYGILPIENSAAGSVAAVYDMMVRHHFYIVKALRLKVSHVLLGVKGSKLSDIREVSSHQHALAQCSNYLKGHPEFKLVPDTNTAVAAKNLATSGRLDKAVIASRDCAELYGLDILAEDIADAAFNYTRFICISKNLEIRPDARKISIMLSLQHQPGMLNSIISRFAAIELNLTKLESRPIPGMDFEFRFTFDFEASLADEKALRLLAELETDPSIEHFTFLGAYAEN